MGNHAQVTNATTHWATRLGRLSLAQQATLLPALFALLLLIAGPIAWIRYGSHGIFAAVLAAFVCLVSGWLALLVTRQASPRAHPAMYALVGMSLRTGFPLAICLLVSAQSHWLMDYGFVWFLLAAYGVGLISETAMSLAKLQLESVQLESRQFETESTTTPAHKLTSSTGP